MMQGSGGTLTVRPAAPSSGNSLVNPKLREHVDYRARSMKAMRTDVDGIVAEISSMTQPTRTRFMPQDTANRSRKRSTSNRLHDGHGTRASNILTNGLNSGLSSPSRKWFKLKIADADLMESFAVKSWLETVEDILYSFLQGTNFYEAAKRGYSEIGLFGTEACFMESHWRAGLVSHALTFGEYWIAEGDDLRPDSLLRSVPMTTRQIVQRFVAETFDKTKLDWTRVSAKIKAAWDASNYDSVFEISHLCEPNPAWDRARLDADGKPWRSVYWEPSSDVAGRLLAVEGCFEQPFYAARWDTVGGGDPWGTGPGWDALADLRALQLQAKRLGAGMDQALKPAMMGPARRMNMNPGAFNHVPIAEQAGTKAIYELPYQVLGVLETSIQRYYGKIDEHFYVDLFMAISQMDGVQPRNNEEIFSRNEEKLSQLGPVIERVNVEKLGVAIDRVFGVVQRMGLLPPAPEELFDMELQVDYVSILAQAQRAVGLSNMERSLGFIGNLSGRFPDITDNLDTDVIANDYWVRSGAPVHALRDPAKRDQIRAQRAQAMQAQQARESMPAVNQAAQAAELMSRTDVQRGGGQPSLLESILGAAA